MKNEKPSHTKLEFPEEFTWLFDKADNPDLPDPKPFEEVLVRLRDMDIDEKQPGAYFWDIARYNKKLQDWDSPRLRMWNNELNLTIVGWIRLPGLDTTFIDEYLREHWLIPKTSSNLLKPKPEPIKKPEGIYDGCTGR